MIGGKQHLPLHRFYRRHQFTNACINSFNGGDGRRKSVSFGTVSKVYYEKESAEDSPTPGASSSSAASSAARAAMQPAV